MRFPQTASITNRTDNGAVRDANGRPAETRTTITSVCYLQQQASSEDQQARDTSRTRGVLFLPLNTTVTPTSTVVVDGTLWEIIGEPNQLVDIFGRQRHMELVVEKITG